MGDTPAKCPTCGTGLAPDAVRCPQCGRVFGEANRCPHCNAIAAVRRTGAGYACVACGKPREVLPSTTVLDEGRLSRIDQLSIGGVDPASAAISRLVRFAGVLLVGAAVVAGAAAAIAPGAPIILLLVAAGALGSGGVV